ncbi:unnamed protein product [Rhizophagus irregularis]|nr:unnamed protein product [Rhizophagus irregularis]
MSQMRDISVDKIFTFDDEPHNGKPITMIEISPNENYFITYSERDSSIVGWNVEDIDKVQLKFDKTVKINHGIKSLCVSDNKKLAYICRGDNFVIDMDNKDKNIALSFYGRVDAEYCTFNLKGEFILYSKVYAHFTFVEDKKIIWIYSTQTKNDKWECKRFYRIPEDYELISISKYDKVYLFSNDYIYEWNINTERGVKIFGNNKDKNKFETKNIGIFSNDEKFIFLKTNDKIIVYSIELEILIDSLDINDDIQLYNFMNHTGLFLLPSLFYYTPDKDIKYCWNNKYKNRFNQTLFDESTDDQTKFVFGILNERVWKSENMSKAKVIECDDDDKKTYKHLNVHLFNLYIDTVSTLFQKAINDNSAEYSTELAGNLIKWGIYVDDGKIKLEVFKKGKLISMRIENYHYPYKYDDDFRNNHKLIASSLFNNNNNNDIVILTTFGILIYTFSENNKSSENDKSIFLNYFYFMKLENYSYRNSNNKYLIKKYKEYMKILQHYKKIFSKSTLPLPNYDSFRLDGWVSNVINNKSSHLKYGVELLKFAIKEHKLELIDDIYKKCMTYFKEDLMNNKSFLSIITSTMPLLNEYYPKYILKYTSETNMIIDSSFYTNLSQSLLWTKYHHKLYCIRTKYEDAFSLVYFFAESFIFNFFKKIIMTPTITFMVPYINFVNYSKDYNWFLELIRPQPSSFTETINKNIYKTSGSIIFGIFLSIQKFCRRTSLFSMFLLSTGTLPYNWQYDAVNPSIIALFSLPIVVYRMHFLLVELFELFNNAINENNNRVSYLIQKAEILAEIELFYLLPHQRRWQAWFPEVIHYYADADEVQIEIKRLIKEGEWDTNEFTEMKENLLKELQIKHNPINANLQIKKPNEVLLEKLKSSDEKLDKLDKLETEKDKAEAFYWYKQEAEDENISAQYKLGLCYEKGIGTEKDDVKASYWYEKALANKNKGIEKNDIELFESNIKNALKCDSKVNFIPYNEFENVESLNKGGFGHIMRATWTKTNNYVICKKLIKTTNIKYDLLDAFIHELKIHLRLDYYNDRIIRCLGVTFDQKTNEYFLIMQYANGGDLQNYLKENFKKLTWDDKKKLALQIADGLNYLHKEDVLHRDLHSKNIVIHDGNAKITDFGISKIQNNQQSTIHFDNIGIIAYMEPKRILDLSFPYTKSSDIYSFGVLMWEISSGFPPFKNSDNIFVLGFAINGGTRETVIPDTPIEYEELYKKCWRQEPEQRPVISEVLNEFKRMNVGIELMKVSQNDEIQDDNELFISSV